MPLLEKSVNGGGADPFTSLLMKSCIDACCLICLVGSSYDIVQIRSELWHKKLAYLDQPCG